MKKILFLTYFILIASLQAQTYLSSDEVKTQRFGKETLYKDSNGVLLDGHYKIAKENGSYSDAYFQQGRREGKRTDYDYKERIVKKAHYKNGKADGKYTTYHQNGKIRREGYFKMGKEDGEWKLYNDKGEVKAIENYKNGKKEGKWWKSLSAGYVIEFYKNDKPSGHWERKSNGILDWEKDYTAPDSYIEKKYFENGKLAEKKEYKDAKLNGEQLIYDRTGILLKKELYSKDIVERIEKFYENGRMASEMNFKNGQPHGAFTDYKRSGAKSLEGAFEYGSKSGVWKQYRGDKGWLYFETTYKNDTENGPHKTYYRSGKVEKEGNYKNGSEDGIWKYYNPDGSLAKEVKYDLGKRISSKSYN